jgi:hypothetical protein
MNGFRNSQNGGGISCSGQTERIKARLDREAHLRSSERGGGVFYRDGLARLLVLRGPHNFPEAHHEVTATFCRE